MSVDLIQPILNVVKRCLLSAVVHKNDTHGSLVVGLCDCPESFLAGCVPHLKLYSLVTHLDGLDLEIDT